MNVTMLVDEPGSLLTVRHVRAAGTPLEIGRQLAAAAQAAHGPGCRPRRNDPAVERVRRRWFALHWPQLAGRSVGVAEQYGLDADDPTVALDVLGTLPRAAGCSVTFHPAASSTDGHALLARNMDFPTTTMSEFIGRRPHPGERAAVADPWVVELHPTDGPASVTVCFGDVLGAMDGVNEAGLAVALLADDTQPSLEPAFTPQVGLSELQVVRYLLDTCTTAAEARDALRLAKHYYISLPCHYVVADRRGDAFVWELSRHRNREYALDATTLAAGRVMCTNHLLHRWPDASEETDETVDDGLVGTAGHTFGRWRSLSSAMAATPIASRDDVREQLAGVRMIAPTEGTRTIWHALYDLSAAEMEISFLLGDVDGVTRYTAPMTLGLRAVVG